MSSFMPNKVFLRGVLLHYFNMKKKAAESHRILVEAFGDHALTERTCQKWFARFKSGNFDLENKEYSGHQKKFENENLGTTLEKNPAQTQGELPNALGVDQKTISDRLKEIGMTSKEKSTVSKKAHEGVPVNDDLDEEEIDGSEEEFESDEDDNSYDDVDDKLLHDKDDEKMTSNAPSKSPNISRPLQRRKMKKKKKKEEKKENENSEKNEKLNLK